MVKVSILSSGTLASLLAVSSSGLAKAPKPADLTSVEVYSPSKKRIPARADLYLPGRFEKQSVKYDVIGDLAVLEGDMVLGDASSLQTRYGKRRTAPSNGGSKTLNAAFMSDMSYLWPGGVIPYEVAAGMPANKRADIQAAITRLNKTALSLRPKQAGDAGWVVFRYNGNDGCNSYVGRILGAQTINISEWCMAGSIMHEVLHAAGFYHEQSRNDRDKYVRVNYQNISPGWESQYEKHGTKGIDLGPYDYASIMHYGSYGSSKNNKPTMEPLRAGVTLGQREDLSPLDVQAIETLYGSGTPRLKLSCKRDSATSVVISGTMAIPRAHAGYGGGGKLVAKLSVGGSFMAATPKSVVLEDSSLVIASVRYNTSWYQAGAARASVLLQADRGPATVGDVPCPQAIGATEHGAFAGSPQTVVVAPPPAPPVAPPHGTSTKTSGAVGPFDGTYSSTWGPVVCTQTGNRVLCSYRYAAGSSYVDGKLDCGVSGQRLGCTWLEAAKSGKATFTLVDQNRVVGTWGKINSATDGGSWNWTRASSPPMGITKLAGTYQSNWGPVECRARGASELDCSYRYGKTQGAMTCKEVGTNALSCRWREDNKLGGARFSVQSNGSWIGTYGSGAAEAGAGKWELTRK